MARGSSAPSRLVALDVARGLAVLGVVLSHVIIGLSASGVLEVGSFWREVNDFLVVGRMPALCFLVGLFIPLGVTRRGAEGYVRTRVVFLVWVYLVWYLIQASVEVLTNPVKNVSVPVSTLWTVWEPLAHLWFLPFIALATSLVVRLRVWSRTWLLVPIAAISAALWTWTPPLIGIDGIANLFFVALGAWIGLTRMTFVVNHKKVMALGGIVATCSYGYLVHLGAVESRFPLDLAWDVRVLSFVTAVLGVMALLGFSTVLASWKWATGCLGFIGQQIFGIYAVHVIVAAGLRIVLGRMGFEDPVFSVPVIFVATALLSLVFTIIARRLGCSWLLEPPSAITSRLSSRTAADSPLVSR